jgi:hypothetical protein
LQLPCQFFAGDSAETLVFPQIYTTGLTIAWEYPPESREKAQDAGGNKKGRVLRPAFVKSNCFIGG